jgi:hypothetical protein
MIELNCFSCSKQLSFSAKPGFRSECPHCRSDVHVCKNCQHYDVKVYNECKETQADRIVEKERANYCEYYSPRSKGDSVGDEKAKLRAAADALFKKSN